MQLTKIRIKNYRLLIDAELEVDPKTTLIVGRNNTAKTSCFSCIGNVLNGAAVSFDDYPLLRREDFYTKISLFMEKKLSYEELCKQIEVISIEFLVDYSLDDPDDNLGALSPFIIDVDVDTTTALIRAEYRLKTDEKNLWALLESSYYKDGTFSPNEEAHNVLADNFGKLFGLTVYAINPNNLDDKQVKSQKELHDLFPFHAIPAERVLGEDDTHNSSLGSLISGFFDTSEAELDPDVAEEIKRLRTIVEKANKDAQKQSDEILSAVVNNSIGFGYPNIEELRLGVTTQLSIDDQIKNQTKLSYISGTANESLPGSHNSLGYKNLIKMEFLLTAFAKDIEKRGVACVPLLFIEEPESHMHPQMQTAFAMYLEKFLGKLSTVRIQTFLTSHSAHIANTMEFAKIRYAQKSNTGVIYKNLNTFAEANPDNVDFIRKYLTLTRCDLFFADKAIFVEGASERLLLPDMIERCEATGVFGSCKYPLSAQYYALIEIGGAYAHKFIPFIEFLGVPCLILTDLDSVADRKGRGGKIVKKTVVVSEGETTSNETIKWWIRRNKGLPDNDTSKIDLSEIIAMTSDDKTRGKCHIEFQTTEKGLCGHSLEEAIRNVNRKHYNLGGEYIGANYDLAKAEADKVDAQIIETLKSGHSFRVEAGAGSGKTYSLNRVIEWIQENKWSDYSRKKQNVVCITYTNAAVDVIAERLAKDSFILPSTIHSFAWNAIKQYQSVLIEAVTTNPDFLPDEGDFYKVTKVDYNLGHRYKENGIQYLYHDDVLKLFCLLLDNAKFRRVFADKYPLILIDEYQDSYKPIIDRFVDYFIAKGSGPQFGFFGDAWQTIYQSNKACGAIEHDNIDVIKKNSNFRSAPRIVQLLNDIRPDLPQKSAIDAFDGEVVVITCEDYTGTRRTDRNFKGELPPEVLKARLDEIEAKIKRDTPNDESLKILMITHKVLATQQGYEQLLDILGDGLRNKEDPFLLFFMNTVEPVYKALCTSNTQLLFDTLDIKRYPITKKSEKVKWQELREQLAEARTKKAIDVLELVCQTDLIPMPPKLDGYYRLYHDAPETMYIAKTTIRSFLELEYTQFLAAIDFLYPEAVFSTEHGVKGEEYDNVVFVVSKGWNQYQFETYAPMITGHSAIPKGKEASFERNRNLFYVCCSRLRKRLFFFVTVPVDPVFRAFLTTLVGEDKIFTYQQFVEMGQ